MVERIHADGQSQHPPILFHFHFLFNCFWGFFQALMPNNSSIGTRSHLSILLRIPGFFLNLVVQLQSEKCQRRSSSKFPIVRFFNRFNPAARKGRKSTGRHPQGNHRPKQLQGLLSDDSMAAVIGTLALLSNSVAQMNHGGIALHVFTIFFYLILLFRKLSTRKIHFLLPLAATLACSAGFALNYLTYKGLLSLAVWTAWSRLISFACLYALTQVIVSRLSPSNQRNELLRGFLISTLLSILLNMSTWSWASSRRKFATEKAAAPTWTADLLLSCQTFFHVLRNSKDPKPLAVFISSARSLVKDMARMLASYPYQ